MNWLRKLRNSALFIDLLLVLAAVVAIIGLATFVRLHTNKVSVAPASAETLTSAFAKAQSLSTLDSNGQPQDSTPNSDDGPEVKAATTSQPSACGANCNLSTATLNPVPEPIKPSCNEDKKEQFADDYEEAVKRENTRYELEIRSRQNPLNGIIQSLESITRSLLPAHQQTLSNLQASFQKNLDTIYCKL